MISQRLKAALRNAWNVFSVVFENLKRKIEMVKTAMIFLLMALLLITLTIRIPGQSYALIGENTGNTLERGKFVSAVITGYSSEPQQTDDTPFIMANGERVHWGSIACPRKYPFGTIVRFFGSEFVCKDRMNIRFEKDSQYEHFDIWFHDKQSALEFGVQNVEIRITDIVALPVSQIEIVP